MMTAVSHFLTLSFESQTLNEAFAGVCVHEVELTERLSAPFMLKADLLLDHPLSKAAVRSVLGTRARITIRSKHVYDHHVYYAERCVCAIVSRFRCEGIIYAGGDDSRRKHCARYTLTLEPKLAALEDTRATRTFSGKTPPEVILAILQDYGMAGNADTSLLTVKNWDNNQYFQQQEQSDWSFIARLMLLYGLNFNFIHSPDDWEPKLCLTNSWVFEAKKQENNASGQPVDVSAKVRYLDYRLTPLEGADGYDGLKLTAGVRSDFEDTDVVLLNWSMDAVQSVDRITVGTGDDSQTTENAARALNWSLADALNQYETRYGRLAGQQDLSRIVGNLTALQKLKSCLWHGTADSLSVTPGTRLTVKDFFGDDGQQDVLIVRSRLSVRDAWPNDLAFPPKTDLKPKPLQVEVEAVEYSPDSLFCPSFVIQPDEEELQTDSPYSESEAGLYAGYVTGSEQSGSDILTQTAASSASEYATAVHVQLDGVPAPVIAEVGFAGGSNACGLRYFPRCGDKVLVAGFGGRWFIISYLPSAMLTEVPDEMAMLGMQSDTWQQNRAADTDGLQNTEAANRIVMNQGITARQYVLNLILTGRLEQFFKNYAITVRDEDYYHVHDDVSLWNTFREIKACGIPAGADTRAGTYKGKSLNESVALYIQALRKVRSAQQSREQSEAAGNSNQALTVQTSEQSAAAKGLSDAWSNLTAIADYVADNYLKGYSGDRPFMALQTEGNMLLSAGDNGNMALSADDITVTADKINISTDKQIVLSGAGSITFKVATHSFYMDNNGLTLRAVRKMSGYGPFNSMLDMDSLTGVNISGISCAMNGTLRSGFADAFGNSVTASSGSVSMSGLEVNKSAGSLMSVMINFTKFVADMTTQLITLDSSKRAAADTAQIAIDFVFELNSVGDTVYDLCNQLKVKKPTDNVGLPTSLELVLQILTTVQLSLDMSVMMLIANDDDYLRKDMGNGLNGRDALELASLACKLNVTLDTIITFLIRKASLGMKTKSSVNIRAGDVQMDSTKFTIAAHKIDQVITPGAGV